MRAVVVCIAAATIITTEPVCVAFVILIGLHEVAFVIMIGLHISDLFCSSLVVEPDVEAGVDTLVTEADAAAAAFAVEPLAVMMVVLVPAETGVFVDDAVLLTGVFCTRLRTH